ANSSTVAAENSRNSSTCVRWDSLELLVATRAPLERAEPSAQSHSPEREISERQIDFLVLLDRLRRKQQEPERRVGRFPIRQDCFGDFRHHCERDARRIVLENVDERFYQLALIDAHEFASLAFEKPDAHIRHALES